MSNSKELLRARKNHSRAIINNNQRDIEIHHAEKKPIVNIPSNYSSLGRQVSANLSAYSPMFAQPETNQPAPISTNWNPKKGNEVTFPSNNNSQLPKVTVNIPAIVENENKIIKPIHHGPSQSQRSQEHFPLNTRVNLVEMQRETQEEKRNNVENNPNKSMEEAEEGSFTKNRSVSKCWEGDSNIGDNLMAGSLGSTIVPRTNNCSVFNETFENFLGDNINSKLHIDEKKFNGNGDHVHSNKNYDLPVSMSNLGAQIARNNSELESVKSKILKRKQSIENKRIPSIFHDPSLLLNHPGITENSEESLSSFHRTVEYDSLQKPYDKKTKCHTEEGSLAKDSCLDPKSQRLNTTDTEKTTVNLNKRNSYSPAPNGDSISARNEAQNRMVRSTSTAAIGSKNEMNFESSKKENIKVSSDENNTGKQHMKHEEIPSNDVNSVNSTKTSEQFAIAKFDYNAQKENDLSFNKGDKIRILRKTETGWWIGLCNNKIGYFPYNFVSVGNQ